MSYAIFFTVSIILFISGSVIIYLKKDRAIGGISLIGSLIYFVLAILILNSDFEIEKINRDASASTIKSSRNVSVSGNVVSIQSSSNTPSRYIEVSVLSVQKLPVQQIKAIPIATANVTSVASPIDSATTNNEKQYVDANGKGTIIGDTDSKIYHMLGSAYYPKEMKKTTNNVYFRTIKEAEVAGYRAPKR